MQEAQKEDYTPHASTEQRLRIRNAQFNLANTRDNAAQAIRNAEQVVTDTIVEIAKELKVDVSKYSFDLSTLDFTYKV